MPGPKTQPCGGINQPPCPPVPASEPKPKVEPPKGDDGDVKKYQDSHGHQGAL